MFASYLDQRHRSRYDANIITGSVLVYVKLDTINLGLCICNQVQRTDKLHIFEEISQVQLTKASSQNINHQLLIVVGIPSGECKVGTVHVNLPFCTCHLAPKCDNLQINTTLPHFHSHSHFLGATYERSIRSVATERC